MRTRWPTIVVCNRILRGSIAAVSGFAFAAGCTQASLPGTALGTYKVKGTLGTNTCGSSLGANNPWNFSVNLSEDGTTLYWENTDGTGELSSTLSSSSMAALTTTTTANVDADSGAGVCYLQSTETVDLTLASGSPPTSFTGTITYAFAVSTTVATTVNCADQLVSSGGSYATLPCSLTYSMKGTRQ